jgi:predicted secreted protein
MSQIVRARFMIILWSRKFNHLCISIPAKFNCTVPGTLSDCSADYTSERRTFDTTVLISITTVIATNLTVSNGKQPSKFEVGSRLFNIVVGAGGGMVVLLACSLCCVCAVLICKQRGTKGESK